MQYLKNTDLAGERCTRCHIVKPGSEFHRGKCECKSCRRESRKALRPSARADETKWAAYEWPAGEEWRDIEGWPEYQVSDSGRVRSRRSDVWRLLSPWLLEGYPAVYLHRRGRRTHAHVHVLICEAWHGPSPFAGAEVCHNDGNRTNCVPSNLRWDTHTANVADSAKHGTMSRGSSHPVSKITEKDVLAIRAAHNVGGTQTSIAASFGISQTQVSDICSRKSWRHVP